MQMCPFCDKVYDESEYSRCPYCSGELEDDTGERYFKIALIVVVSCIGMTNGNAPTVVKPSIQTKTIMMELSKVKP